MKYDSAIGMLMAMGAIDGGGWDLCEQQILMPRDMPAALAWEAKDLSVDLAATLTAPSDGQPRNRAERRAAAKRMRKSGR